jgi:hypothetical protein
MFDTSVVTAAAKTVLDDTSTGAMRTTLGAEPTITTGTTAQYWRGDKAWTALDKAAVGLGNVDNTSDAAKPVSTAQATADNLRVLKAGDTMSGDLTISKSIPSFIANKTSAADNAGLYLNSLNKNRWSVVAAGDAESGGNVGSSFYLSRYNDAGTYIDTPLSIDRATGIVTATGLAPKPQVATNTPGYWQPLNSGAGVALTLPAGGSWAYAHTSYNAATGGWVAGFYGGIVAGGTVLIGATTNINHVGFAWRIA